MTKKIHKIQKLSELIGFNYIYTLLIINSL